VHLERGPRRRAATGVAARADVVSGRRGLPPARWWSARPAHNRTASTYRCPICGRHLAALSEHMLIAPEGDTRRRRHAHTVCVVAARRRGELPLRDEWLATQPRRAPWWRRWWRSVSGD